MTHHDNFDQHEAFKRTVRAQFDGDLGAYCDSLGGMSSLSLIDIAAAEGVDPHPADDVAVATVAAAVAAGWAREWRDARRPDREVL